MSGAVEGACARGDVYLVSATLRRPRDCAACGVPLARGDRVQVGISEGDRLHVVLCGACDGSSGVVPRDALAVRASSGLASSAPARGSLLVWSAVAALGAIAVLRSRTMRRILATGWVALKALGRSLWARLRGRREETPAIVRSAFEDLGPTY